MDKEYIITFKSTHHAIFAETSLKDARIPLNIMAVPTELGTQCGICVRLEEDKFEEGLALLNNKSVPYSKIFLLEIIDGKKVYTPWKN